MTATPKRRWNQFSLWKLVALTFLVVSFTGFDAVRRHRQFCLDMEQEHLEIAELFSQYSVSAYGSFEPDQSMWLS